ncbi:unnamed protein product [Ranitomeya imitator]|uniref:GPCR family 3 nine cysteines domain-containing protein n=1 Tax=Ranitomeya imitator TaxID=111125 RepID=A0ABN9MK05_9NEOB|nr:unnamed protein product [Ranitomeya imitator]
MSQERYLLGMLLLSGSLSLASNDYIVPGLRQFLDKIHPSTSTTPKWTKMMWETVFNCQFLPENQTVSLGNPVKVCTGLERIEDIKNNAIYTSSLKMTYVMFVAVHVLVKALDDLKTCKIGEGPFSKRTCANIWHFKPWQLLYYMRRVKVNINLKNEKYFDENGDPPGLYAVANWNLEANGTLAQVKIGIYNNTAPPPEDLTMNRSVIVWNLGSQQIPLSRCSNSCTIGFRKAAMQGKQSCCYACVPCLHGEFSNKTGDVPHLGNCISSSKKKNVSMNSNYLFLVLKYMK